MLHWIASNTIVACGFAVLAALATVALRRRPAAGHLLWLCVLVALATPPLPKLGVLDGRAHAERLATRVGAGWAGARWLRVRAGAASTSAPTTGRDASPHAHPTPATFDPRTHALTCKTCAALATALGEIANAPADTGVSEVPARTGDSATRTAYQQTARRPDAAQPGVGADPGPAPTPWDPADKDRAASMAAPPGWTLRPEPTDWAGLGATGAVALWLAGSAVALARLLLGWRALGRLVRAAAPADADFLAELGATARELGVRPPRVRLSVTIRTPFIVGGPRPVLLWPRGESLDAPGARAVLAHELAHLARRDHWAAWLEALTLCLLWWHPLAHLARAQTRALAERACDAWVVWAYPEHRRDYADALVAALERLTRLPRPAPALAAVDSDKRTLARRLVMIMQGNIARRGSRLLAIGAITLTAALAPSWAKPRLESFGQAIARADIDRSLQTLVDAAKLERLARTSADAEEFDQAIGAYQQLIRLSPDRPDAYHDLAMAQYHAGRYADAAQTFAKGAQVASTHEQSWWQVGGVSMGRALQAAREAKLAAKVAQAEAAKHAAQASELAAAQAAKAVEQAAQSKPQAVRATEQAAKAKAQIAEVREKLAKVQAELAASGVDIDIEDQLAGLENDIDDAVADATDQLAEIGDEDWADFDEAFADMGDWDQDLDFDFDFDFDFGGMIPLAEWAYDEACCHALAGDQDAAIKALSRALSLGYTDDEHAAADDDLAGIIEHRDVKEVLTRMKLARSLLDAAEAAQGDEQWDAALESYQKAGAITPENGVLQHQIAYAALRAGDRELALRSWSRALELGYSKPNTLYNLACASAQAGDADGAIAYLKQAAGAGFGDYKLMREDTDLDPVRDDPRFGAALDSVTGPAKLQRAIEDAIEFEEWSAVIENADTLLASAPERSWIHTWAQDKLALAYFYTSRYDAAEDAFAAAAIGGGDLQNNLYNIACCRALSGKTSGALDYLHAAVDAGWDDADHLQHDDDLAALRTEPGFDSEVARAADNQILDQFGAATWEQLQARSEREIGASPEDGQAHLHLGWALLRTGHADRAIPVFRRQAELGFAPGIAVYNIACCHAIMGDADAAIAALRDAFDAGFNQPELMAEDPDLRSLRDDPRFQKLAAGRTGKGAI